MKPIIVGYEPENKNNILTTGRFKNVNVGSIFESIPNSHPNWWERLLLRFVKPHYGADFGSQKDKSVLVVSKVLFGKIYIVEVIEGEEK